MQYKSPQAGFTLIELLISMTIFSVVMTMAAGTLLVLLDANAKSQNKQQVLNNLTLAIDSMGREIRTGSHYVCDGVMPAALGPSDDDVTDDCPSGNRSLTFRESGSAESGYTFNMPTDRISYSWDPNHFAPGHGAIVRRLANGDWLPVTSRNIRIDNAEFVVTGANPPPDLDQPNVTIFIEGSAGALAEVEVDFQIQSSITQRVADF